MNELLGDEEFFLLERSFREIFGKFLGNFWEISEKFSKNHNFFQYFLINLQNKTQQVVAVNRSILLSPMLECRKSTFL